MLTRIRLSTKNTISHLLSVGGILLNFTKQKLSKQYFLLKIGPWSNWTTRFRKRKIMRFHFSIAQQEVRKLMVKQLVCCPMDKAILTTVILYRTYGLIAFFSAIKFDTHCWKRCGMSEYGWASWVVVHAVLAERSRVAAVTQHSSLIAVVDELFLARVISWSSKRLLKEPNFGETGQLV